MFESSEKNHRYHLSKNRANNNGRPAQKDLVSLHNSSPSEGIGFKYYKK